MEILLIVFLVLLNGIFAMSEIAIVSSRRSRLIQWSKQGDRAAGAALNLMNAPNVFLSTVQIGITLIGILAGAIGYATVVDDIAPYIARAPFFAAYSEAIAVALVVIAITYLTLIVGELVPKRLALYNPERIARVIALPMQWLSRATYPAVRLLSLSMDGILRLVRAPKTAPPVTDDEIKGLIEEWTQAGVLAGAERDILKNAIRLFDRSMSMLMQPRSEIVWLDLDDTPEEMRANIMARPHSRYPVVRGALDNIVGIVHAKDLLAHLLAGKPFDLEAVMRPPLHVPETMPSLRLLEIFRAAPEQMALVVDEYGELRGIVTLDDVLEALVGGLAEEGRPPEPSIVRRDDGSWLLDGGLSIDELKEVLNIPRLPDEESGDYETLAGFIMTQLGRIPAMGESFVWSGLRFEVIDMDGNRIDRVLAVPASPNKAPDDQNSGGET